MRGGGREGSREDWRLEPLRWLQGEHGGRQEAAVMLGGAMGGLRHGVCQFGEVEGWGEGARIAHPASSRVRVWG